MKKRESFMMASNYKIAYFSLFSIGRGIVL
jgi:hypothetical protein